MNMKSWDSKEKIIAVIQANTAQDLEAEVYNAAQIIKEYNQPTIYKNNRKPGPKPITCHVRKSPKKP